MDPQHGSNLSTRNAEATRVLSGERLIIFVKAPRAGMVKTRLASAIGAEAACAAYRKLAGELFQRLHALCSVELRFSPDDAANEISQWRRQDWQLQPQGEGDLGMRMARAFDDAFANGARYVVVIGSDCPGIMPTDIESAWIGLRGKDVVIGPARDGGYWLIGLRLAQPALFQGIEWSSDKVLEQTLGRARERDLKVEMLRELSDVDTERDWLDFLARNKH